MFNNRRLVQNEFSHVFKFSSSVQFSKSVRKRRKMLNSRRSLNSRKTGIWRRGIKCLESGIRSGPNFICACLLGAALLGAERGGHPAPRLALRPADLRLRRPGRAARTNHSFGGSFSAASTPIFASKYAFCSIFQDLQENYLLLVLYNQENRKQICTFFAKFD